MKRELSPFYRFQNVKENKLVFYCCHKNDYKPDDLSLLNTFIILVVFRSKVWHGFHWARTKV